MAAWSLGNTQEEQTRVGVVCPDCQTREYGFDSARSYALYKTGLVRAIVLLKFERIEPLGLWFAKRLAEIVSREALTADVVVPVPLHQQRERGYNQADLIARPLARKLGLPYRAVLLVRTKPRPDKHILSLQERWDSVRGAFATRPGTKVDNLRVLLVLVDDVMTTGATLDAGAKALRGAGARSVIGLTVARAARHPS
jgi:ComF family protein